MFIARDCQIGQQQDLDAGEKIKTKLIDFDDFLMLSEDSRFRDQDILPYLLRLRLNEQEKQEFKELLFSG